MDHGKLPERIYESDQENSDVKVNIQKKNEENVIEEDTASKEDDSNSDRT
jgi:cell division protease FtsH